MTSQASELIEAEPVWCFGHAEAVHIPPSDSDIAAAEQGRGHVAKKKRRCPLAWKLVVGTVTVTMIPMLLFRKKWFASSPDEDKMLVALKPSPAPTSMQVGEEECRKKRITITEICNVSGLGDELVELKILVNDKHYWPKQVEADCLEGYGSDGDSCVVPSSSLTNCFRLSNSIELPFVGDDVEGGDAAASIEDQIKVTIYDTDFLWDDIIEVIVPKEDWYRPNLCEKKELEFTKDSCDVSTRIKMVVDFGNVENPCGVEEETLLSGLNDAAVALENVQMGLSEYARGISDGEPKRYRRGQRRLIFPLLATGFRAMAGAVATGGRSFVKLFTRQSRVGNVLSTTADMAEIGSFLLAAFGDDKGDEGSGFSNNSVKDLFDKVFDRFDKIDGQLDSIQGQIQDGFDEIKLVITEEFAQQELDEWITFRLGIKLRGDYLGYMERSHTASSRRSYEDTFRQTCNGDYSPYNIFQVLYSHSCQDCQRLAGKSQQYFLDTYVNLASANFDTPMERVLWFRRSFGTVIIGALTEAIYFYSVCLIKSRNDVGCDVVDPVWDQRLREMGDALEEVVASLGDAEDKLV